MAHVLIISTAHDTLGDTGNKTGVWLEELAAPYYALLDAGHDVTVATLAGDPIPVDPASEPGDDGAETARRFKADEAAMARLSDPKSLSDVSPESFDAVYIPGGHGAVWDLSASDELAAFLAMVWVQEKPIASVCHGPAALVRVEIDGQPLVYDKRVAAFTDSEEKGTGLTDVVPFLLETRLSQLGAQIHKAGDMQPNAVADGRLITGQNPMSSDKVAELLVAALDG